MYIAFWIKEVRKYEAKVPRRTPTMPYLWTNIKDIARFKIASQIVAFFVSLNKPLLLIIIVIERMAIVWKVIAQNKMRVRVETRYFSPTHSLIKGFKNIVNITVMIEARNKKEIFNSLKTLKDLVVFLVSLHKTLA